MTTLDGIRDIKLYQNKQGYRFSVDPLLLHSFVNIKYAHSVVDLGTGSGILGILLARTYPGAKILLVELQESLFRLAERNVVLNGLEDRVEAMLADINELKKILRPMSFDLAVSNPPFRKPHTGRLSCGEEKAVARHELRLKLPELVESASYLLKARGRFFMIFHPERVLEVVDTFRSKRLEPKRMRFVHNDIDSDSKIVLLEAVKNGSPGLRIERPLVIYNRDGSYTAELEKLYGA